MNKNVKSGGFFKFALFTLFLTVALLLTYFDTIGKEQEKIQALKPPQLHKETENVEILQVSPEPIPPVIEVEEESVNIKEASDSVILKAPVWVPQTFNNCGPATVSMILQNYGYIVNQKEIKEILRANSDDRNVFLYEIRDYLKENYPVEAKIFYNGDMDRVKLLLANGFYIISENWLHKGDDIGHFSIIRGYDDKAGVVIIDDSYLGLGIKVKYEEFDVGYWKAFNRTYMPVYKKEEESILKKITGEDWDETKMHERTILTNMEDAEKNPKDVYAWFNIGMSYYSLGEYQKSWESFIKAENVGWPARMLWYQIYPVQNANAFGRYEKAIEFANQGLKNNGSFAELHYEKAFAYYKLEDMQAAKKELETTLKYDPDYQKAKDLLSLF